jgi:hypothetical protein
MVTSLSWPHVLQQFTDVFGDLVGLADFIFGFPLLGIGKQVHDQIRRCG